MTVTVSRARRSRRRTVWRLLQLYLHDMSGFDGRQLDPRGAFTYPYFPLYWTEQGRHPFLLHVDGALAGFALARRLDDGAHEIAEFFVVRSHRRRGVGRLAATAVLDELPGRWEIRFHHDNTPAATLWTGVAAGARDLVRCADEHQVTLSFTW